MNKLFLAAFSCLFLAACGSPSEQGGDSQSESLTTPDLSCVASGGTVGTATCCLGAPSFPNLCRVGACGCSPTYSKPTAICRCPAGTCFDGTQCSPTGGGDGGTMDPRELACRSAGGTVVVSNCCPNVGDFPSSCAVGACGCAPAYSHPVKTCRCPTGACFDGTRCVPARYP